MDPLESLGSGSEEEVRGEVEAVSTESLLLGVIGGRGHRPRNASSLQKLGKARIQMSSKELRKELALPISSL